MTTRRSSCNCGSAVTPGFFGVAVGAFTDPTFPPPKLSGFEAYGHPWAMTASDLPLEHHD